MVVESAARDGFVLERGRGLGRPVRIRLAVPNAIRFAVPVRIR